MFTERFKNVTSCFDINLSNNKTIILLNLAEYRLIIADSAYGLIRRYSARFRRIIVNYVRYTVDLVKIEVSAV